MKLIVTFFYFFFISTHCFSQSGFLDTTFGDGGKAYFPLEVNNHNYCGAVQPDDKILAGGLTYLARFLPDGGLDESFGNERMAIAPFTIVKDIQVLENGEIIAGGTFFQDIAAAKYTANGQLDASFGNNGSVILDFGEIETINAVQIQDDGKVILAGRTRHSLNASSYMLMIRLNPNGSLDENFGKDGRLVNKSGYEITCLGLQLDGRIVTGGHLWPIGAGDEDKFSVSRYNIDGTPDTTFGTKGTVLTDISNANDYPLDLLISIDGKMLVAGRANHNARGQKSHMSIVKYNTDGTLDESFGVNGISNIIFEGLTSLATGLLVQEGGKIILTGTTFPNDGGGNGNLALARLKTNGTLDSSFAVNGKQMTEFGDEEVSYASGFQTNGKIVLIGDVFLLDVRRSTTILARYNNDEVMPLHFTYFNATPTNNGGITLNWQIAQENNNACFAIERTINNDFAEIARINSKGNSSQLQTYSYTDNTPLQGTNFYRLKQVDRDGKFSYSQIVSAVPIGRQAALQNGLTVVLYPNPVKDVLNIKGLDAAMSYELSVMNAKGNIVANTSINNIPSYTWNLRSLSRGVYYLACRQAGLSITSSDKKTTVKFVKQ